MSVGVMSEEETEYRRIYGIIQNILFEDPSVTEEQVAEVKSLARAGGIREFLRSPESLFCDDETEDSADDSDSSEDDSDDEYDDYGSGYDPKKNAEQFWNGEYSELGTWDMKVAIDSLFASRVKDDSDAAHVFDVVDKILEDDNIENKKELRWCKADYLNVTGKTAEALALYKDMVSKENGYVARPTLASAIVSLKLKERLPWDSSDFVYFWSATSFKIKQKEFPVVYSRTRRYLDEFVAKLERELGWDYFAGIFQNAIHGTDVLHYFYRLDGVISYYKNKIGPKSLVFHPIDSENAELNRLGAMLYSEMKMLNALLQEVRGIDEDWIHELDYYVALRKAFPDLDVVHHYNTAWLWKFNLDVYIPSLKIGFVFQGDSVKHSENFVGNGMGQDEYNRLLGRALEKASKTYSIEIVPISSDSAVQGVCDFVAQRVGGLS